MLKATRYDTSMTAHGGENCGADGLSQSQDVEVESAGRRRKKVTGLAFGSFCFRSHFRQSCPKLLHDLCGQVFLKLDEERFDFFAGSGGLE